jgi:hypothetical protein
MTVKKLKSQPERVDLGNGVILLHGEAAREAITKALDEVLQRVFSREAIEAADAALRKKLLH